MLPWSRGIRGRWCFVVLLSRRLLSNSLSKTAIERPAWEYERRRATLDPTSAENIRKCIDRNRRYRASIVLEYAGARDIVLCTDKELHMAYLQQEISKVNQYKKMNESKMIVKWQRYLPPLVKHYESTAGSPLSDDDAVLLVGFGLNSTFLISLAWMAFNTRCLFRLNKTELFLLLSADTMYKLMHPDIVFNSNRVLLDAVFHINYLMKLPVTSLTLMKGVFDSSIKENISIGEDLISKDYAYLVHFVVTDNFRGLDGRLEFVEFQEFVRFLRRQERRLIPKLESTFPGSGLLLLNKGYTMVHEVKHLKSVEYYEIFQDVRRLPTYKDLSVMKDMIFLQEENT